LALGLLNEYENRRGFLIRSLPMSTKGIYTALSGAMAQNLKLETTANNLANINTPAFKKDQQVFREYLTAFEKGPETLQVPKIPASIESFYEMQGADKSYVDPIGTYTQFTQGGLKATGNKLDVAIDGPGFFEVATPKGIRLTRSGSFNIDGQGQLVNHEGYPILKKAEIGADPASRVIKLNTSEALKISNLGELMQNEESLGQLSLVQVSNNNVLQKEGQSLFSFRPNQVAQVTPVANPKLEQGFLETSNVNIVQEMTDMIMATRLFENATKAMQAYDNMADKLVNVVPKSN
jgi:flagellar basal-body rod protein FlgG